MHDIIRTALREDLAYGPDVTTLATVAPDVTTTARIVSRAHGVVARIGVLSAAFDVMCEPEVSDLLGFTVPDSTEVKILRNDGDAIKPGDTLAELTTSARALFVPERTVLNILSHASGIASTTRRWVEAVEGTPARVRDTRKTLPGLRALQKYAVRVGGGVNHRLGLGDATLIKDNHLALSGITEALAAVRRYAPDIPCEVEVDTVDQLQLLLDLDNPPQLVLLDNFTVTDTAEAVRRRESTHQARGIYVELESSGGLSLDVAHSYAETGVDYLAVGALTHSVTALDIGIDY